MGTFGESHRDEGDAPACYTVMIANNRVPDRYRDGRFHLLFLGGYVRQRQGRFTMFCGLNRHGATPPISPLGEEVLLDAYRMMMVHYPPECMVNGAGIQVVPLATMPKRQEQTLFTVPPEATTPL